jgi:hypothetical protein
MKKGLNYHFQLKDINKYYKNFKYKDVTWKMKRSALGKMIPDESARRKRL